MADSSLAPVDAAIIAAYFAGMVALGLFLSTRAKGADDYFLAGRSMTWPFIGLSLFASNISSTTLVGLSGDAYATGISVYNYEWMAAVVLVVFAVFFLPLILQNQVFTLPEFLSGRFDRRVGAYCSILTVFLGIVVETAGSLYAGALVLQLVFPSVPLWQTMTGLAVIAGFYTVTGGLSAVMITDAVQALLLLLGSFVIAWCAFDQVGGLAQLFERLSPDQLSLVRPLDDAGVPWLGLVTGVPLLGFYYWVTNQAIVQRVLAAKSVEHGRWGTVFAGALKLLPLFIMVLPGSAAILLYPDLERSDLVYPTLMFDLLPSGLLGLTLAGFLAAIMSQIDSSLNSASTLVTMDFVRPRFPGWSSARLMTVGRVVMGVFLLFAVAWAPFIAQFRSIFAYLQTVMAYAVPPVVALFLVGTLSRRANAFGAFVGLCVGVLFGVLAFTAVEVFRVVSVHFLYVAPASFALSGVCMLWALRFGPSPDPRVVARFVWTPELLTLDRAELVRVPLWRNWQVLAGLLLASTAALVVFFW